MQKEGIFLTTNIFKLVHPNNPCTMWASKNPIFIRATPCQRGFAAKCPVHKFRCVSAKLSSWLGEGSICDFWPFLLLPHFSSEMPIFIVRKGAVPEPPFRVDPEPPRFLKKRGPPGTRPAYIYIYMHARAPSFRTRFGPLDLYLGLVALSLKAPSPS